MRRTSARRAALIAAATALVLLVPTGAHARGAGGGHGHGPKPPTSPVSVTIAQDVVTVPTFPCSRGQFVVTLTNDGDQGVYADAWLSAEAPVRLSRTLLSTYVSAHYSVSRSIAVSAPPGAPDTDATITVRVDSSVATVTGEVRTPDTGGNLARPAAVSASSTHVNFSTCSTVNGVRSEADWGQGEGWNDSTKGQWPDWIAYGLPGPSAIGRVELYTLAGAPALRDWDIQVHKQGTWTTVAEVRGSTAAHVTTTFAPVQGDAVRIWCLGTNRGADAGDYARILEVEIYG